MWISVALPADAIRAEALSDALLAQGAISVSIEDAWAGTEQETPQFGEPGDEPAALWEESRVVALFEPADDLIERIAIAAREAGLDDLPDITLTEIAEQNWVQLTQSQFEPIRINDRLWIVPSWHMEKFDQCSPTSERSEQSSSPPSIDGDTFRPEEVRTGVGRGLGGRHNKLDPGSSCILQLDPGMAFGTGSHPTTRLCLEWLSDTVQGGEQVLDYGCGSGILGIAAAKLGAAEVVGVDIDEKALDTARDNAVRNGVTLQLHHSRESLNRKFDLVVANILTNPLKILAPLLAGCLTAGGRIALSGVLEAQTDLVIEAYGPYIVLRQGAVLDGWCRLEGSAP